MGFDNECILNIQSLPGEYFCPVCRTLIYPNEALQAQCTHLYCKPCLAYVVATTKACPYDGYLVTETDSKPLMESNKSLAESIGQVTVHCLYNKSGCQWQGTLSASMTHGTSCAYGNSPVVCNRCGTQIVHRQVREHAQLCPGLQSQTQQSDGSQAQASTAITQAVTQDSSLAPAGSLAAPAATLPSATTATAVTASAAGTGGPAVVPSSYAAASATATQTPTAEHWYQQQQLQYSQYYQQHYPGYNPYMQQYQQYGQYQQVYQQYAQPQMQVASQSMAPGSAQPASYVQPQAQSSQPQYMMQSQSHNQPQLQPPTGVQQSQQHPVQPHSQSQTHLPHLQAPAGQSQPQQPQPMQPTPQIPQMQPQSHVGLQPSGPQTQSAAHPPAPTQVGNQQHVVPSTQSMPLQVQQHVQANPPQQQQIVAQQQHAQLQTLPPQQHLQPQMQQTQHQPPQMQQQSYPQPQSYAHPTPHGQSQNPSYQHQQMPQSAPLQHTAPHQQGLPPKHPAPMRPPVPGQQPAMLPQAIQYPQQNQQHTGHNTQRPPMHSSIPTQTLQQGLPSYPSGSSQAGLSYQQGMPSSQQQVQPQSSQPYGLPYTQQHIPGHGYSGHHVQSSAGRPTSHVARPQQFQHQHGGPSNDSQASVMNQPPMPRTSDSAGQGSLAVEVDPHASKFGKSEVASNVADNTTISENINGGAESAATKPPSSQSLELTGVPLSSTDGSVAKAEIGGRTGSSHGPAIQGGKDHSAADASNDREKGAFQQASRRNAGALGSYGPLGKGPHHPSGPDRMLPQHMMYSDRMPYNMPEPPNQMRPPKHTFSENIRPPMQKPHAFGENQMQMPMPQPVSIRPGDIMIQPPMVGALPGRHDTMMPPFGPEHLGRPAPLGMSKGNGLGGKPLGSGKSFHEEGFNPSGEHLRSFAAYPGGHKVNLKDIEDDLKQFPRPTHLDGQGLQRGPGPFERTIGRPDGFPDSLPGRPPFPNQQGPFSVGFHEEFSRNSNVAAGRSDILSPDAEFGRYRADGMPNLRNQGPFVQGMSGGGPGGHRSDQLGSVNLPGSVHNSFDGPEFPRTHFYSGHMHPDDPNLVTDYSLHGFPKETSRFGLGGLVRNGDVGWCKICMFNCGTAENLDLHVQTREHQQYAMDIILKMKQDVAKRQKMR
ncbi:hypothetical protein ACP4OV_030004 [Aristida adscensionis]